MTNGDVVFNKMKLACCHRFVSGSGYVWCRHRENPIQNNDLSNCESKYCPVLKPGYERP